MCEMQATAGLRVRIDCEIRRRSDMRGLQGCGYACSCAHVNERA